MKIKLAVRNQGHVPSFKTQKKAAINRNTGQPMVVSKPEHKEWMKRCVQSFESQLFCATQTAGPGMPTVPCQRSLIASSLPQDDSRHHISELIVCCVEVPPGEEGAEITIERIT